MQNTSGEVNGNATPFRPVGSADSAVPCIRLYSPTVGRALPRGWVAPGTEEDTVERTASAVWLGNLRDGRGTMSGPSGVLRDAPYTFATRFENAAGTNPEELVGAAHAGCFSMALSGKLTSAGVTPERIATTATVTLEKTDAGMTVTKIHLDVTARVPGATPEVFATAVEAARTTCPISRLLKADISVSPRLET